MESAKQNGDKNGDLKDHEVEQVDFSKRLSIYSLNNLDMVSRTHTIIGIKAMGFVISLVDIFFCIIHVLPINISEPHKK